MIDVREIMTGCPEPCRIGGLKGAA